jgi:phenylalanyl-tRNA synthetase beta chain
VVRQARGGEKLTAIDQRVYELAPGMCVIADATRPVAIAGVMGGLETEIGPATRDVLIEAAEFLPMSVRATARRLNLHSDSSYRFERGVDREFVDWASRRCCQLILETAGGQLAPGVVVAGTTSRPAPAPVVLRLSEIPRVLGIEIPAAEVQRILGVLGLRPQPGPRPDTLVCSPPSWRKRRPESTATRTSPRTPSSPWRSAPRRPTTVWSSDWPGRWLGRASSKR